MGAADLAGAPAADATGRRGRLASPAACAVIGVMLLALFIAAVPLAGLAHQNLYADSGSLPVWVTAPFAVVGLVLAWRRPANPVGWIMLGGAFFFALSEDASYYTVADYGLRHGDLPLGGVALFAQPGWAPGIVLLGLLILVFPDEQAALVAVAVAGLGLRHGGRAVDSRHRGDYGGCPDRSPHPGGFRREPAAAQGQ